MDAGHELVAAMIVALKASAAVSALAGARIFDRVPQKQDGTPAVSYPYVSLGVSDAVPDDVDCIRGEELVLQWDVWSSGAGEAFSRAECRKLCDALKRTLHDAELSLSVNALVTLQWERTRILDDPDPAIHHGVVQFTATVETP